MLQEAGLGRRRSVEVLIEALAAPPRSERAACRLPTDSPAPPGAPALRWLGRRWAAMVFSRGFQPLLSAARLDPSRRNRGRGLTGSSPRATSKANTCRCAAAAGLAHGFTGSAGSRLSSAIARRSSSMAATPCKQRYGRHHIEIHHLIKEPRVGSAAPSLCKLATTPCAPPHESSGFGLRTKRPALRCVRSPKTRSIGSGPRVRQRRSHRWCRMPNPLPAKAPGRSGHGWGAL